MARVPEESALGARKSAAAFRTISEVAGELEVPQHVLRFWETKFTQIRPLKRGGGRRYYRPEDVELLRTIRGLLYDDGYTIRGVQKLLREGTRKPAVKAEKAAKPTATKTVKPSRESTLVSVDRRKLKSVLSELKRLKVLLDQYSG